MQRDLCKSRSQSNLNSLSDYETTNEDAANNLKELIDHHHQNSNSNVVVKQENSTITTTTIDTQQRFHQSPYDLRRKCSKKSKDDIDTTFNTQIQHIPPRSTNSSPNLNQTQRKKQRKCNSCSINHDSIKFDNSNSLFLNLKTGDDFISKLPDEILLKIFTYLGECELCRLASVSKKFYKISNDCELWKRLYQDVFEYDQPIFKDDNSKFIFINPTTDDHPYQPNVWKASFKQFHKSIHVRQDKSEPGSIAQELLKIKLANLLSARNGKHHRVDEDKVPIIFVHKGTYKQECLVIDHDVSIIGCASGPIDSLAKKVIIENSEQTTMHFTGGVKRSYLGYVSLLFKPNENTPIQQNQHRHALLIDKKAKPKIFNCILKSTYDQGSTICVFGESTEPTIKNCIICDCSNVGIFIDSFARGVYENNLIARNVLAGVWVKNFADPTFKRNVIANGLDVGVFCFDNSHGWFESNDIHSNRIAGFEVKGNANPTVIRCKIHNGRTGGIYCHESAKGVFLENKIYSNNFAGIWITSHSSPTIRNNEIYDGCQGGIYVFGEGKGIIEYNNIHSNALAGIQIRSSSDPIIRYNRIHSGLHGGIYFHEKSKGLIENNEIFGNKLAGIWITTESSPIIKFNRIHSGKQVGVYFYDNGNGLLEENEIFNHLYSGIQIRTNSDPIIKRNKIWAGANGGILIYNGGLSTIIENEIFDNAMANVWIKTDSNPVLRGNKIYEGKDCGICIFNGGRGTLIDNNIFRNSQAGVLISSQSDAELKNNRIHDNFSGGIEITNGGTASLKYNQIYNNKFGGLCLATNVNIKVNKSNKIFDNENLIDKAIQAGQCLYKISSYIKFPMHDFFRCNTCNTTARNAICSSCINLCHKDHEVEYIRFDRFYCDCGSSTLPNKCKLIETTQETDTLYDSSAPTESKLDNLPVN